MEEAMEGSTVTAGPPYPHPKENWRCKKCGKPTRSHFDSQTDEVTCHVCWSEEKEKRDAEEEE